MMVIGFASISDPFLVAVGQGRRRTRLQVNEAEQFGKLKITAHHEKEVNGEKGNQKCFPNIFMKMFRDH